MKIFLWPKYRLEDLKIDQNFTIVNFLTCESINQLGIKIMIHKSFFN